MHTYTRIYKHREGCAPLEHVFGLKDLIEHSIRLRDYDSETSLMIITICIHMYMYYALLSKGPAISQYASTTVHTHTCTLSLFISLSLSLSHTHTHTHKYTQYIAQNL